MKLQDIASLGILGTALTGPSFIKLRADPNSKAGYLFHEGFPPRKSIRKIHSMKGEQK
jgi:hypothetical protein